MDIQSTDAFGPQAYRLIDTPLENCSRPRMLVAGMGNILRGDDGFGVEVARKLATLPDLPANVSVIEVGIGGIHLVQELMTHPGYDGLLVVDALDRQREPGQVYLLEASVPDIEQLPETVRRDFLADMHYAVPARALTLAKAIGVLPTKTWIVGCQPGVWGEYEIGLTLPVQKAVDVALAKIMNLIEQFIQEETDK